MMAGYWPREGLLDFIEEYRNNECLWKTKSKNYHNRVAKEFAYYKLLDIVKKFEPSATKDYVTKKINNIRTSFRKEYRKVLKSRRAGSAVYVPKLWYYNELNFLLDQEEDPEDGSNMEGNSDDDADGVGADMNYEELSYLSQCTSGPPSTASNPPAFAYRMESRKRKLGLSSIEQATADTLQMVGERFEGRQEDQHDVFGKHVAHRLRNMNPDQVKYAQKLISDVLFEADMECLNRNCKIGGSSESDPQYIGHVQ